MWSHSIYSSMDTGFFSISRLLWTMHQWRFNEYGSEALISFPWDISISEIARLYASSIFNCLRNLLIACFNGYTNLYPHQQTQSPLLSTPSPTLVISLVFLIIIILTTVISPLSSLDQLVSVINLENWLYFSHGSSGIFIVNTVSNWKLHPSSLFLTPNRGLLPHWGVQPHETSNCSWLENLFS